MMRSWIILTAATLAAASCSKPEKSETVARAVRAKPIEKMATGQALRYSGTLEPLAQVDLAFKVPGKIAQVAHVGAGKDARIIHEGDPVVAGQVLASLDLADLLRQERAAAAAVATASAQVQAAKTSLTQTAREVERARRLFEAGDLSQAEMDRAETAHAAAKASLDAAEAQLQAKTEQRALSKNAIADAALRSPMNGVVARRTVDPGEVVGPGAPAFSIIDATQMRLVFGVPDTRVSAIRVGMKMALRLEAQAERSFEGAVSQVAPVADPSLRTYAIEILVPNPDGVLKAGMLATAVYGTGTQDTTLVTPLASVVRGAEGKGYAVFVVDGGRAVRRAIEIGDVLDNDAIIRSGLTAGELVVTDGAQLLRDGDPLQVVQ